jgi:hypothetical protein
MRLQNLLEKAKNPYPLVSSTIECLMRFCGSRNAIFSRQRSPSACVKNLTRPGVIKKTIW